jgi:ribonuclease VapC
MVVDTSALLSILFQEEDAQRYADAIAGEESALISAGTLIEAGIVLDCKLGPGAVRDLSALIERAGIEVAPVDAEQAQIAIEAYRDYGKGNHAAGLNFGDCFAYALVKVTGAPLLFKGDDFSKTDITICRGTGGALP